MSRFLVLLAVLVAGAVAQEDNVSGADELQEDCDVYRFVKTTFRDCRNRTRGDRMSPEYILQETQKTCSKVNSIKSCMEARLGGCPNWNDIQRRLTNSLNNCVNGDIPARFKDFLLANKDEYLSGKCIGKVVDDTYANENVCNRTIRPESYSGYYNTLADAIAAKEGYYRWYINCFNGMPYSMDEKLKECCHLTRKQVYSIMLASIQPDQVFGFMVFKEVQTFIAGPQNNSPLQQIVNQVAARDAADLDFFWPI